MLRVEKTLEISTPRDGLDVNRLEEVLLQEMKRFGKELWESVLASLEETILTEREGEAIRKRRVSRHLLTRLGWIRFQRYQVAKEGEEKKVYLYLLDEVLGLEPNQRETLGVRKRGVELASDHPYRQAAELLGQEIGEEVSTAPFTVGCRRRGEGCAGKRRPKGGGSSRRGMPSRERKRSRRS